MDAASPSRSDVERELRARFEAYLPGMIERRLHSRVHPYIPVDFFSVASSECRDLFISGNYFACITLAQSVAEGLAKYIAECAGLHVVKEFRAQIDILQARNGPNRAISPKAFAAFKRIHKNDRDSFHHLRKDIPQNYQWLEQRAAECVEALYEIDSEVFGFTYNDGALVPNQPKFWPKPNSDGTAQIFVRD
jgi:hypothetical protein